MDFSDLAQALVTVVVAVGSAMKASKGTAVTAGRKVKEAEGNLATKLNEVIAHQKSEGIRLDKLTERVDSLAVNFKMHDRAQLEREKHLTQVSDTISQIALAQKSVASQQKEIAESQKIWLSENTVLIKSKKGNQS